MAEKNKDDLFDWKMNEWTMGNIETQGYFIDRDGNEILQLEVIVPSNMKTEGHLRHLLTKDYKSVIITPDAKQKDYLQISFTDIDIDEDDKEMTD